MFDIGEEVICIDNSNPTPIHKCNLIVGKIYIVLPYNYCKCCIYVGGEHAWSIKRFRRPEHDSDEMIKIEEFANDQIAKWSA
jgi:hypothetical protein